MFFQFCLLEIFLTTLDFLARTTNKVFYMDLSPSVFVQIIDDIVFTLRFTKKGTERTYLPRSDLSFTQLLRRIASAVEQLLPTFHSFDKSFQNIRSKMSGKDGIDSLCDMLHLVRAFIQTQTARIEKLLDENDTLRNTIVKLKNENDLFQASITRTDQVFFTLCDLLLKDFRCRNPTIQSIYFKHLLELFEYTCVMMIDAPREKFML